VKKIYFLFALLIATILTNTGGGFAATEVADMYQAENLLSQYHSMLENGNTSGILGLLTGPMLKSSENLLRNNPKYAGFLRERYRNSSFAIVNYKPIDTTHSLLDVLITLNTQEKIKTRLTLVSEGGRIKIYSEEEINTKER
jgi:hypothetical protein